MAWPILCETEMIKKLLDAPAIHAMFHISKIEMGKLKSGLIVVEGANEKGKKIKTTFKVSSTGSMSTGCPDYSFTQK